MILVIFFFLFSFGGAKKKKKSKKDDSIFNKVNNEEENVAHLPKRTALPTPTPLATSTPYPTPTKTPIEWKRLVDFDKLKPKVLADFIDFVKPTPYPSPTPVPPETPAPTPYPTPSPSYNKYWYLYQLRPQEDTKITDEYDNMPSTSTSAHKPHHFTRTPVATPAPTKINLTELEEHGLDLFQIKLGSDSDYYNENTTDHFPDDIFFEGKTHKKKELAKNKKRKRIYNTDDKITCHRSAKLVDDTCICQFGLVGDGYNQCIFPKPSIVSIKPRRLSSIVRTKVTIKLAKTKFIPQSVFCMVGTTIIQGEIISETKVQCDVAPRIGRSRLGVSFDGKTWDKEKIPIIFERKFIAFLRIFINFSNTLIVSVIIIGCAIFYRFYYLNKVAERILKEIEAQKRLEEERRIKISKRRNKAKKLSERKQILQNS
ncbi:hypothetical protein TVAG_120720 [Trichomonas vaginalis G3]|uniref:IPT/TIG domain-containing protein n=1 Tax=Trichomonas vaginalis (strain ATCC PRA-98 / G3) TaxID=412133 RepID=A2D7L7_TRIV3|nr:immunoglobulins domain-containing protein [Trichomonas vaginalis G3]EAY23734.1 hypothetical protein TVAG_120720 [Trichomonas vaginalis G3]KAI5490229.1 immunoglobulins domain-containing protein [Trichomonas vaginalis G3]|eukprot:XP_001276982.1 hypothetical protein [Trichomonas vaginalis G3]